MIPELNVLRHAIASDAIWVTFTKKSGETRHMRCTTNSSLIPVEQHPKTPLCDASALAETALSVPVKDPNLFTVFDLDINEWRSFRYEKLIDTLLP